MTSEDVCRLLGSPSGGWRPLADPQSRPHGKGVYVVRVARGSRQIGRLVGQSDLIYVGHGSFAARLQAHAHIRGDLRDRGWLFGVIQRHYPLEVAMFPVSDPCAQERDLLFEYFWAHFELPPANNQLPNLTEVQRVALGLAATLDARDAIRAVKEAGQGAAQVDSPKRQTPLE